MDRKFVTPKKVDITEENKEEYEKKIQEYNLKSRKSIEELKKEFYFWQIEIFLLTRL